MTFLLDDNVSGEVYQKIRMKLKEDKLEMELNLSEHEIKLSNHSEFLGNVMVVSQNIVNTECLVDVV